MVSEDLQETVEPRVRRDRPDSTAPVDLLATPARVDCREIRDRRVQRDLLALVDLQGTLEGLGRLDRLAHQGQRVVVDLSELAGHRAIQAGLGRWGLLALQAQLGLQALLAKTETRANQEVLDLQATGANRAPQGHLVQREAQDTRVRN